MSAFSKFYLEFLKNILKFFLTIFKGIWDIIVKLFENVVDSLNAFFHYSKEFGALGWVFAIIILAINFLLFFFLSIKIYQFMRKYLIFRKKELEKDKLLEEIAYLNDQTNQLVEEKNGILNLKMNALTSHLGAGSNKALSTTNQVINNSNQETQVSNSRFAKLSQVDKNYAEKNFRIFMSNEDKISLEELTKRFVNFSASQLNLYYKEETIRLFFAGLATSKILILEGISGTGKTSLPYAMGKFFRTPTQIVSVQPSWRDRAEILGYFNEFTKKFNETDFLRAIYETTYREDVSFIILDEMNLARIEYYFADFLSMLEMPDFNEWKIDLVSEQLEGDPINLIDGKILIPQNVWFIGTANKDDSTFTITDKVYDRASTLEFSNKGEYFDAPLTESVNFSYDYLDALFKDAISENQISQLLLQNLSKLDEFIQSKFKIAFGNRILKQIKTFIPVYVACGGNELNGLDFLLRSKILRKFESLNIGFMHQEIDELINLINKLFGKNKFKVSINYLNELKKMM